MSLCSSQEELSSGEDCAESEGSEVEEAKLSEAASVDLVESGRAALEWLEQLQRNGDLGRERAVNLRRKYLLLQETLESSRSTETVLLTQTKQLEQELTQQLQVLEGGDEVEGGETARLRRILLTYSNQQEQSQQRLSLLETELASVEEEHGLVKRELERQPRQADMEARVAELRRHLEDLRDEIRKRSKDTQHYTTEIASRDQRLTAILEEIEELRSTEGALQDELVQIRSAPGNLPREIDLIRKRYKDTRQEVAESEGHCGHLREQLSELETRQQEVEGEVREAVERLGETRDQGNRLQDLLSQAKSSLTQAKERQAALLEQQASLELGLRHKNMEHGRVYESLAAVARENDSIAKQVKRVELQREGVGESEVGLLRKVEGLQARASEGEVAAREREQQMKETRSETESLRRGLSMQEGVSAGERVALEERQREEEKVREKVASLTSKLQHLHRETVAQTREGERVSRSFHQATVSELGTRASLSTKEAQLREEGKTLSHLRRQLTDFSQAYKLIKTERNHTHSQIQQLQQLTSEMREKWRVLQNEAEVLTTSAQEKDKLLHKCGLVISAKSMERDSERQTVSKLMLETAQNKSELDTQREILAQLSHQVSSLGHQLNQMRRNYEHALQERNDTGLQLIERNEEVCVFHERLNMQEAVLRQANLDLMAREEELRYLKMEVMQLKTHILVGRKSLPDQSNLQLELELAQKQLSVCEAELRCLESRVEDAKDSSRVRLLPGPQVSQEELLGKLESLESRLAGQEQAGLEKELLYEQICRLTDRAKCRTSAQRDSTLQVAQRVGQFQSRIKDTTRRTMALVSELTMQQANALRLRQEVREREAAFERAYQRLEAGQPPDEVTEQQWQQLLREEERMATLRKTHGAEEEVESAVEHRPNAYLPTGEGELPLPKPYGSHAPFKPSEAGANMRHIRKPQPKPIDI